MCGRYALALRASEVRQQLEDSQMAVQDAPQDSEARQSYNFAPGYHGLVYRAATTDANSKTGAATTDTQYKLQAMQWGLVPFWTKRNPDYASKMKTINCRDDSLVHDAGMWTTMKKKKRCVVIAQGFFEWLNKGSQKVPHFTRRADSQLMCLAGLWDMVQFEDSGEKLYTYSIITTGSNPQLAFLHDRMPVILDNGSTAMRTWLDPARTEWSKELQSLLQPYDGDLECYPVSQDVGKVGNNSPAFLVPIDSAENKNNIANFFGKHRKAGDSTMRNGTVKTEHDVDETRATTDRVAGTEDNVPLPVPATSKSDAGGAPKGIKRRHVGTEDDGNTAVAEPPGKTCTGTASTSPAKAAAAKQGTRSATSNGSAAKRSKSDGSRKITSFFSSG